MQLTAEKLVELKSTLGNALTQEIDQGAASIFSDHTIEAVNYVDDPSATILIAKHKARVDGHVRYQVYGNLPTNAPPEDSKRVFDRVFTDTAAGMPANGRISPLVTFDAKPGEPGWTAESFASAAIEHGYDITNPDGLLVSPAAEVFVEFDHTEGLPDKTKVGITRRSPKTTEIDGTACNTAEVETFELVLPGDRLAEVKACLEQVGFSWEIDEPTSVNSWGSADEFLRLVEQASATLLEGYSAQATTSYREVNTRVVAIKPASQRVDLEAI